MQRFTYPIILTTDDDDGGYVVTCRDVPEVVTQGATFEEAISEAEGALEAAIEMRIEDGLDIPLPTAKKRGESFASLPITSAMKAALYIELRNQDVKKTDLARMLGMDEKEARRMLDPKHGTKVPALERALHILGKRVSLVVESGATIPVAKGKVKATRAATYKVTKVMKEKRGVGTAAAVSPTKTTKSLRKKAGEMVVA